MTAEEEREVVEEPFDEWEEVKTRKGRGRVARGQNIRRKLRGDLDMRIGNSLIVIQIWESVGG